MGIHEGRGNLTKAMKDLNMKWNETKSYWDDSTQANFEKKYILPIEKDMRQALAAMDTIAVFISAAHRDCE